MNAQDIRTMRKTLGLSQKEMADRLGIDQSTVHRLEQGRPPNRSVKLLLDLMASQMAKRRARVSA